jgi:hypothetical protein
VLVSPEHIVDGPEIEIVGVGLTNTVFELFFVQPFEAVTNALYVVVVEGFTLIDVDDAPVFHDIVFVVSPNNDKEVVLPLHKVLEPVITVLGTDNVVTAIVDVL